MAIELIDGFDSYNGVAVAQGLAADWSLAGGVGAGAATSMQTGRFGGQSVRFATGTGGFSNMPYMYRSVPNPSPLFASGVAVKVNFAPAQGSPSNHPYGFHMHYGNGTNMHLGLFITTAGQIQIWRTNGTSLIPVPNQTGATLLVQSATGVITVAQWHYIEIEALISDTIGFVNVFVDGVNVITSGTTLDTRNGAAEPMDLIVLGGLFPFNNSGTSWPSASVDYDDLYVKTGSAVRAGEGRIEVLRPSADTADKDFVPDTGVDNFSRVNETLYDVGNYVQGSTVGDLDRYEFGNLSTTPTEIYAVQAVLFGRKTDAGTRAVNASVLSGATASDGPNLNMTSSDTRLTRIMEVDPNTGAAWLPAAVNALKAGPKVAV